MPRRTPLFESHQELGAKFVDFAGWEMPIQYTSILKEHEHVRTHVGLFDVSHMGEIDIRGQGARDFCQKITCNDVSKLKPGKVQYTAILNEAGGMIDDCTLYMFNDGHLMFVVNASRKEAVLDWLYLKSEEVDIEVKDRSEDFGLLAVQGAKAPSIVSDLIARDVQTFSYYEFQVCQFEGQPLIVSRTGYTGEDGFEIYIPMVTLQKVWDALMHDGQVANIAPIGLGARDTLRLEMGYRLYGSDMNEDTTPFEAGLGWIVDLDKGVFVGSTALKGQKEQGGYGKVKGLLMEGKGIPRPHCKIFKKDKKVGEVLSGTFSPTLKQGIALARIKCPAKLGTRFEIDIRGKRHPAIITKLPFVETSVRKL